VGGIAGAEDVPYSGSPGIELTANDHDDAQVAAEAVRFAARLVDTPPEEMGPIALVAECDDVVKRLASDPSVMENGEVSFEVIAGEDLDRRGYGGIYGVGKGAKEPPALAIMSYTPRYRGVAEDDDSQTMAWVGKGIVYDTGGLSLKISGGMVGMKSDMGGAAAVIGAFEAAVKLKTPYTLHAFICVAENAIGPESFRNDDVLRMLSGKTVEINNSDAEGRLVLADGVNHASKMNVNLIVDIATLTGAQMVTTGKKHAAVMATSEELETRAVDAGRTSGDLTHPLIYCPEFYRAEFKSKVADMKNSVKDRMNSQAACAGTFIGEHLDSEYTGEWLHVDIAGPSTSDERGTGYGVGLLLALASVFPS